MTEAGWFTDPSDPARERYWDGNTWSDRYRERKVEAALLGPPIRCPFCQEAVRAGAVVCGHCGRGLALGLPTATRTNGMAIASMVLGIVWIYWIGSVLALVFGYIALRQIDESRGAQGGRGMAIAGVVLGWVGVGILALVLLVALISTASIS